MNTDKRYISEHYRLEDCSRAELLDLKALWEAVLDKKDDAKTLLAVVGWVSAIEMLATINALLKAKADR